MSIDTLNQSEVANVADYLKQPAENFGNDETVELQWAMKAFHHAETYFNLISSVDPVYLKLTRIDDEIYKAFRSQFPDLDVSVVSDDILKSEKAKQRWREFCNQFEGKVEDFNMGTLLRLNCDEEVDDKNTTLVPRIQFLAIEIARNREGLNSGLRQKYGSYKAKDNHADDTKPCSDENS